MKNIKVLKYIIIFIVIIGSALIGWGSCLACRREKSEINTKVTFLDWNTSRSLANLVSINLDGSQLMKYGTATGSLDWSNDGKYLAVGCSDPTKICIYLSNLFTNSWVYPPIQTSFLPIE